MLRLVPVAFLAVCAWPSLLIAADPPAVGQTAGLDAESLAQVQAAIEFLKSDHRAFDDVPRLASALRDLIETGKPAAPLLIVELDTTDKNMTLRGLGFALRGINDPRAIPALIRALPRTLMPPISDYGVDLDDPELLTFMQKHEIDAPGKGKDFGYGRPFREIVAALHKLTGTKHWEMEVNFVHLGGSAQQVHAQRQLYRRMARTWAEWWSKNWQKYLSDPVDAEVEMTLEATEPLPPMTAKPRAAFPTGASVVQAGISSQHMLAVVGESRDRACMDLDTGRTVIPPVELMPQKGEDPSPEFLKWARSEGVDIIGVRRKASDSEDLFRAVLPVDMRVIALDNETPQAILERAQAGAPFELPESKGESFPTSAGVKTTYAFITRDGACGFLELTPKADTAAAIGAPIDIYDRGMQISLVFEKP